MSKYIVICEDGRQRHEGTFDGRWYASQWADQGHACTTTHTFVSEDEHVCTLACHRDGCPFDDYEGPTEEELQAWIDHVYGNNAHGSAR